MNALLLRVHGASQTRVNPLAAHPAKLRTRSGASLLQQRVALFDQAVELLGLLGDAVGGARLVAGAGGAGGLLDQLPDVAADDGDAILELRERERAAVTHLAYSWRFPRVDCREAEPRRFFRRTNRQPRLRGRAEHIESGIRPFSRRVGVGLWRPAHIGRAI